MATKTRSVSDENNSPKILYLLPGSAQEYEYYGPRNEICLTIGYSWTGGFTYDTHHLEIKAGVSSNEEGWELTGWSISNESVSNSGVHFTYSGTIENTDTTKEISTTYSVYGEANAPVETKEVDPIKGDY